MATPLYLSLSEAARALQLSEERVRNLFDDGRLPGHRVGGRRVLDRRAVERLAAERAKKQKAAE